MRSVDHTGDRTEDSSGLSGSSETTYFRVADNPLMTKEEGFVQLADADPPWCLQMSHSINFPHPGGSRRQVTYNPVRERHRSRV